jgi:hypothetical protein
VRPGTEVCVVVGVEVGIGFLIDRRSLRRVRSGVKKPYSIVSIMYFIEDEFYMLPVSSAPSQRCVSYSLVVRAHPSCLLSSA